MAIARTFNRNPVAVRERDIDEEVADLMRWEDLNDDAEPHPIAFDADQYGEVFDFASRTKRHAWAD